MLLMNGLKSLVVPVVLRVITLIFLLVSLIVIAIDSFDAFDIYGFPVKVAFNDVYVYCYMISAAAIGMAYILLLVVLTIFQVNSGSPNGNTGLAYFEFYSDKVILFLLATGAAAGLGLTVEYKRLIDDDITKDVQDFLNKANASASLLLLASIFSTISSVISSLNLPKSSSS
ncbi:unnamed protein product [Withania somnifera]